MWLFDAPTPSFDLNVFSFDGGVLVASGTGVTSEAGESIASSGGEFIFATAAMAEAQSLAGVGLESLSGGATTGEAETLAAAGIEKFSGTATLAETESLAAAGIEAFVGTSVTAESETLSGVGVDILNTGTSSTAESETIAGVIAQYADISGVAKILYAALSAIFGGKVYPAVAPDNVVPPYAVYLRVASAVHNTLADGAPIENGRYQIDSWATTYAQAHSLASQVRKALLAIPYPIGVVLLTEADQYEADVKYHRVIQDYSIWSTRSN